MTDNKEKKCEILNCFFASVFTDEDLTNIPSFHDRQFLNPLSDITLTSENVSKKLCSLNPTKSPGIDSIHPRLLKECHLQLSYPLTLLFNKSLQSGTLPDMWKLAKVTPLLKKGDKNLVPTIGL